VKRNLTRLLNVRALLEEVSRLDLEKKNAEMRLLESAAGQQRRLVGTARANAIRILTEDTDRGAWLLEIADAAILARKESGLRSLAALSKPVVEKARNELLERRLERRQVEALILAAERIEKQEESRREQNRADEWYQQRSSSRRTQG